MFNPCGALITNSDVRLRRTGLFAYRAPPDSLEAKLVGGAQFYRQIFCGLYLENLDIIGMKKDFNIIISGVGGQGIIILTRILAEAALIEKYDIKTSELHGLSQRGGSVESYIRFGPSADSGQIYSPLVKQGGADLIISLEAQEALKVCYYASKTGTIFLVNDFIKPIFNAKIPSSKSISKELKRFSKKSLFVPASKIAKEKLDKEVLAGVYLLGYAAFKKLIPLKPNSILKVIEKVIPKKYFSLNKKAFNLARSKRTSFSFPPSPRRRRGLAYD